MNFFTTSELFSFLIGMIFPITGAVSSQMFASIIAAVGKNRTKSESERGTNEVRAIEIVALVVAKSLSVFILIIGILLYDKIVFIPLILGVITGVVLSLYIIIRAIFKRRAISRN